MKKVENKCISILNSAVQNDCEGGQIKGRHYPLYAAFLSPFVKEGFLSYYKPVLIDYSTPSYALEFGLAYLDDKPTFRKIVSTKDVTWTISWEELRKRNAVQATNWTPKRSQVAKKLSESVGKEVLLLKTQKGWMFEREALRNHSGGLVMYRLFL